MKKISLLVLTLGVIIKSYCQPQIINPTFSSSVGLFDLFEVSFTTSASYINPYDPEIIQIYALLTSPNNETYKVNAFYYEDYSFQKVDGYEVATPHYENNGWRIRFTPTCTGDWKFRIIAKDSSGMMTQMPNTGIRFYTFSCTSVSNADGFISKANSMFLKRDIVRNGQRQFHSFFPIGPNIPWYSCKVDTLSPPYSKPYGIYEYKKFIDSLDNNANYMRVFLNRYQYLSLYGPEYTQFDNNGQPVVYFDRTINQKDSAELDYIISYAAQHGVAIMPCVFSFGDFSNPPQVSHSSNDSSIWDNNPFHTCLNLLTPCEFFNNGGAEKITKNLLRYIVSRWGYATNIMCWELWNEVSNMFKMCDDDSGELQEHVLSWHNEMTSYILDNDPYKHCISTSMGTVAKTFNSSATNHNYSLYRSLYATMDIVQQHNYQNIQKAASIHQISKVLFDTITKSHNDVPSKPFFMGEFGFGQSHGPYYAEKDPYGIDLHNSLWSSLFSTAIGPGSFWWWYYLRSRRLFHNRYAPLLTFCQNLPMLSKTFTAHQTGTRVGHKLVFPNHLETYYMINATEDTVFGWSQDTAFAYQSLRWLTDSVRLHDDSTGYALHFVDNAVFDPDGYVYTLDLAKRPGPSSNSNIITIPITNQPIGTKYEITWFDTETGLPISYPYVNYTNVQSDGQGNKYVRISFPSTIRDLVSHTINNTFGDVVFMLILNDIPKRTNPIVKKNNSLIN